MSKHVAYLAEPSGYDLATRTEAEVSPGITVVKACRPGSKTIEGMAYEFDASMDRGAVVSWITDRNIDASRFHFAKAEPPFGELMIEGLSEGTHTDKNGRVLNATRDFLTKLAENTTRLIRAGRLKPPVKLGHGSDQSSVKGLFPEGGDPALGWLSEASLNSNRLMTRAVNVPRRFVQAVNDKLWAKPSLEISMNYRNEGPAIVGVACLGATRPADNNLADMVGLSASDAPRVVEAFNALLPFDEHAEEYVFCFVDGESDSEEAVTAPGGPDAQDGEDHDQAKNQETPDPPTTEETMSDELKAKVAELEAKNASQLESAKLAVANTLEFCVGDTIEPGQLEAEKKIAMQFSTPEQIGAYVASVRQRAKVKDRSSDLGTERHETTVPKNAIEKRSADILAFSEAEAKKDEDERNDGQIVKCTEEANLIALAENIMKDRQIAFGPAMNEAARLKPDWAKATFDKQWGRA